MFCSNRHFTCGVKHNGLWLHINDICKSVQYFQVLLICECKGAFFGIYVKENKALTNKLNKRYVTIENIANCETNSKELNELDNSVIKQTILYST